MFVPGGFGRTPPETIGDSRTEFNTILCTSKSETAVTSNKNCAVGVLKLTTDKHEATRGLSVTAELLVSYFRAYLTSFYIARHVTEMFAHHR